jgi:hypothetical protein
MLLDMETTSHPGSCHCGAVKFTVTLDASKGTRCNCSICTKLGMVGSTVKPEDLRLLTDEAHLATYEWGHKVSRRYFCRHCGTSCFTRGHLDVLGGDFASVNLNCLDDIDPCQISLLYWDGRHDNWYAGARPTPWPIFATTAEEPKEPRRPDAVLTPS